MAFQESDVARLEGRILGVEEQLRGVILPGVPDLLARIDLLVETDDELIVIDFKTAKSRWNSGQADSNAEQLLLYAELAGELTPEKTLRLEFAVLTKTKKPDLERHVVSFDSERINRTKRVVGQVWKAITSGVFYPAPSPMNCPTCPFRKPCRDWRG